MTSLFQIGDRECRELMNRSGHHYTNSNCKKSVRKVCAEAARHYPEIDTASRTALEFLSDCFEMAIRKEHYPFANKLFKLGVEFNGTVTFAVGQKLNPALKAIPGLLVAAKKGLLPGERALRVALREMPAAIFHLLEQGLSPDAAHLDEAIRLEYPDVIELFLERGVLPSSRGLQSAIQNNDLPLTRRLLDMKVKPLPISDFGISDEMVDLLVSKGVPFTRAFARSAVENNHFERIKKINGRTPDLWYSMISSEKESVIPYLLQLGVTPPRLLFLFRKMPLLILNLIDSYPFSTFNLNQALNEIIDLSIARQVAMKMMDKGVKPDAVTFTLATERGDKELAGRMSGLKKVDLDGLKRVSIADECPDMSDDLPNLLPSFDEEQEWERLYDRIGPDADKSFCQKNAIFYCVEAAARYPTVDASSKTLFEFLSACFEKALEEKEYFFAQKLFEAGAEINISIPFSPDGKMNPAFKKIPRLFDTLGFSPSDLNGVALLVALREKPDAVPLLLQKGVIPTSDHFDEAILLDNEAAIKLFMQTIKPAPATLERIIRENKVGMVKKLLGGQCTFELACAAIELDNLRIITIIEEDSPSLKPKMLAYARGLKKRNAMAHFLPKTFGSDPLCVEAASRYPELKVEGVSKDQFLSEAFEIAIREGDYSFANKLIQKGVQIDAANYRFLVNGKLNPVLKEVSGLFDKLCTQRRFWVRSMNEEALLVALREMPDAVSYILENEINLTYKHFNEAIFQNNGQIIDACLRKKIYPSEEGMKSAIFQNLFDLVDRLILDPRGLRLLPYAIQADAYDFAFNPANRNMMDLLLSNGKLFNQYFIEMTIEKENRDNIKKLYVHVSKRDRRYMLHHAYYRRKENAIAALIKDCKATPTDEVVNELIDKRSELLFEILLNGNYRFTNEHLRRFIRFYDRKFVKDLARGILDTGVKPDSCTLSDAEKTNDIELIQLIKAKGICSYSPPKSFPPIEYVNGFRYLDREFELYLNYDYRESKIALNYLRYVLTEDERYYLSKYRERTSHKKSLEEKLADNASYQGRLNDEISEYQSLEIDYKGNVDSLGTQYNSTLDKLKEIKNKLYQYNESDYEFEVSRREKSQLEAKLGAFREQISKAECKLDSTQDRIDFLRNCLHFTNVEKNNLMESLKYVKEELGEFDINVPQHGTQQAKHVAGYEIIHEKLEHEQTKLYEEDIRYHKIFGW